MLLSYMRSSSLQPDCNDKKFPRVTSPVSFTRRVSFCKQAVCMAALMFSVVLSLSATTAVDCEAKADQMEAEAKAYHSDPTHFETNELTSRRKLQPTGQLDPPLLTDSTGTRGCVCEYDPDVDYFPHKVTPQYSTKWDIEYHKSFKRISVTWSLWWDPSNPVTTIIYAYQCGTPIPTPLSKDEGNKDDIIKVSIPLTKVGVSSTTYLPPLAYVGQRESLFYVNSDVERTGACTQKLEAQGKLLSQQNGNYAPDPPTEDDFRNTVVGQNEDIEAGAAYFAGTTDALTPVLDIPTLPVAETDEPSPIGQAEWAEYFAAFFNREQAVASVVENIALRYTCSKDLVTDALDAEEIQRPKVVEMTSFSSRNCEADPNAFWCSLIPDAGGELLNIPWPANNEHGNKTNAEYAEDLAPLMENATVIIYADGNWDAASVYGYSKFFTAEVEEILKDVPAVKNQKVFDIRRAGTYQWFEDRPAEPDVFLRDVIDAFYGNSDEVANSSDGSPIGPHDRVFLRNVFTESASADVADPEDCDDVSAPLFTNWIEGGCNKTVGDEGDDFVTIPGLDDLSYTQLCDAQYPTAPPAGPPTSAPTSGSPAGAPLMATLSVTIIALVSTLVAVLA